MHDSKKEKKKEKERVFCPENMTAFLDNVP
jgi:hypothetical protein